nr:Tyrosine-protein kinase [Ipomoea trifida]
MAFCGCLRRRLARSGGAGGDEPENDGGDDSPDLFFDLRSLQIATNFFSDLNRLGHGGFGPVYKGLMPSGQEVAVKKLSLNSRQGIREFTNESWTLFQARKTLELVDSSLESCDPDEAVMCIQIGLLCCQSSVSDRPDMNTVHLMLSSDSFTLPKPGKPAVHGRLGRWTTTSSSGFTKNTNASTQTGATKSSGAGSFAEDYSRNSMSYSSMDEGRPTTSTEASVSKLGSVPMSRLSSAGIVAKAGPSTSATPSPRPHLVTSLIDIKLGA